MDELSNLIKRKEYFQIQNENYSRTTSITLESITEMKDIIAAELLPQFKPHSCLPLIELIKENDLLNFALFNNRYAKTEAENPLQFVLQNPTYSTPTYIHLLSHPTKSYQ